MRVLIIFTLSFLFCLRHKSSYIPICLMHSQKFYLEFQNLTVQFCRLFPQFSVSIKIAIVKNPLLLIQACKPSFSLEEHCSLNY